MTRHTLERAGIVKHEVNRIMSLLRNSHISGRLIEKRNETGHFMQIREYDNSEAYEVLRSKIHHDYVEKNIELLDICLNNFVE